MRATGIRSRLKLLIAVVAALALLPAAAANAGHVHCGDVLTQDTQLDSDLVDCPGNGVVIGADGITLDLNGHTIDGVPFQSFAGVDNSAGHDGVRIRNGSVREFFEAVWLENAAQNRIERNDLSGYSAAVWLTDDSRDNVVTRNTLASSGNGVLILLLHNDPAIEPSHNLVMRNDISQNQYGIFGSGHSNTIQSNTFDSNTEAGVELTNNAAENVLVGNTFANNGEGIELVGQADGNMVSRNRIDRTREDGIFLNAIPIRDTNTLDRNVVTRSGDDGIDLDTTHAVISHNTADFNGDLGIEAVPGVTDGGGNRARGNGDPAQCLNVSCK